MTAPASTLSVAKLNKRYKSRIVVHDVSLSVGSGEVIGLLGPTGAGKTPCFYLIVGLVPPSVATRPASKSSATMPKGRSGARQVRRPSRSRPSRR